VSGTYEKRRAEFEAMLDAADTQGPGTVSWDPDFRYPAYFDSVDFHIQPGNYNRDSLAGYFYHYATKVFSTGRDDNDAAHIAMVNAVAAPADGQVRRILDLACSIGQCVTAFKQRWAGAEVWGIDVAAPMVRYGHLRALEMGLDVHFKQALAEDTGFPDGSFDIVHANILFHEIPTAIAEQVVAEARRLLRPGGVFVVEDFPNQSRATPPSWAAYARDFDDKENGEPYSSEFVYSDFSGLLKRHFRRVEEPNAPGMVGVRIAEK
jgi:ubiquinone/menaquinone biosynthesis C-methylase UbiE